MKILHLISSPRNGASASIKLGNAIAEQLQHNYPGSTLKTRNLAANPFPHLEEKHLVSLFTPSESRSAEMEAALKNSDEAIAELQEADTIIIGVPMYNFNIHSGLKTWIDHVVRAGVTFSHTAEGVTGLVNGKKVYLAIASGGIYSDGPMKAADFTEPYLRNILGFIGITDITTYRAEGFSVPELKDQALEKAVAQIAV